MVRRRQFLIATASVTGGAVVFPQAAWQAWSSPAAAAARTLLIYDPASMFACAAATHARRDGTYALPLEGDPGAFWYRSIAPLLEQDARGPDRDRGSLAPRAAGQPVTITGLTPHAAFFVLSTLAAVAGMRVASRRLSHEPSTSHLEWKLFFPTAASLT